MSNPTVAPPPVTDAPKPIPGLGAWQSLRRFGEFRAHPPAFCRAMVERFGDVSSFRFARDLVVIVNDPALITTVLQQTEDTFRKDRVTFGLKEVLGEGLVTSEGALWRRQRKLLAPPLQRKHIALYADTMARRTAAWLETIGHDEVRDMHDEMSGLTLGIAVEALFGDELPPGSERIGEAIDDVMTSFEQIVRSLYRFLPAWVPSKPRRRTAAAMKIIDRCVYTIIADKRRQGATGDDIISRMLLARHDDGSAMDDRQLRDEAVTMFVAGHETTANALVWTLYLLAQEPAVTQRLRDEARDVLGDRPATAEDVPGLRFTRAVLDESMRLHPPAYLIGREPREPLRLGPYQLDEGTIVLISPWVLHRDPRFFDEPDAFRPERWLDGLAERLPKHAYLPFGGGPRVCIGNHFALMEATIVLAQIIRALTPHLVSHEPVPLQFAVTLRPRDGLPLRLTRATPRSTAAT